MSKQCDKTWVVVEHRGVVIEPGSVQLISKAKAISPVPVVAVVLTTAADRDKLVAQLRPFGADQIMVVTDDSLNEKMTQETAAATLTQLAGQLRCYLVRRRGEDQLPHAFRETLTRD